ncbi:MAG: hypothetical protein V1799_17345 [bacterium]
MRYLYIVIFFCGSLLSQERSIFVDSRRGYAIEYSDFFSLKGGSYSSNPAKVDTHYIAVIHNSQRILFGEFDDILADFTDFRSNAINLAIRCSAADGPDGSTYCEDIDSAQVKRNKFGVTYVELFLRKRAEGLGGPRSEIVGPYFVIDISFGNIKESLYLDWRPNWKPTSIQTRVSRSIVENIKIFKR